MPAPRILFVKLSSLGDVVHHMPAATELRARHPEARIGWAVEEAYAPLVALHPAIDDVIPVALRSLRRGLLDGARWRQLREARTRLREGGWDYAVDTQGLLKSAFITQGAEARMSVGPDFASAREPAAALLYDERVAVPRERHAVERNRLLVASAFGYAPEGPARYGLAAPPSPPEWAPRTAYAVFLHAASREDKRWPAERWTELGRRAAAQGYACVFPGGTQEERAQAQALAAGVPGAMAAPAMDLATAAALLGHAAFVAGVDTGLTHLAVALGRPTAGIYVSTKPELTGLRGGQGVNVGGPGHVPTIAEVAAALALP